MGWLGRDGWRSTMSLRPNGLPQIPAETSRVARAAFPNRCLAMRARDGLGPLFTDEQFAELFAARGRPAWSPARLALVLVLVFVEASPIGRPPTRASTAGLEAARWALTCLTLALTPRCSPSLRARLLADGQTERLLGLLLGSAAGARPAGQERAPAHRRDPCPHGGPRSSPAASRSSRRSGPRRVALAVVAPAWLGGLIPRQWARRYGQRGDDWRLPTSEHARIERAVAVGRDGLLLVEAVYGPDAPAELAGVEAVQVLGATWIQQFYRDGSQVRWRDKQTGLPPASC